MKKTKEKIKTVLQELPYICKYEEYAVKEHNWGKWKQSSTYQSRKCNICSYEEIDGYSEQKYL